MQLLVASPQNLLGIDELILLQGIQMIQNYSDLRSFLAADKKNRGYSHTARFFFLNPVYRFTIILRICEYLKNSKKWRIVWPFVYFYFKRLSVRLGFSVPLNVFDEGLVIVHYGLLVVNPACKIGKNCRVHAGVNIGGSAGLVSPDNVADLVPKIGDNCYIGPGTKIYGGISIGSNVSIGANAVVNKSFADDLTIGGIPAKIISQKGSAGMIHREN